MTAARALVDETAVFAGRAVRRFFRQPALVVAAFAFPMLMLFIQVTVFGKVVSAATEGSYVDRFVPLVVLTTASFAAAGSAAGLYQDLHSGLLDRLRTMPVRAASPLVGKVLGDVIRIVLVAVAATVVAHLVGFGFHRGPVATAGFFAVVALFGVMVTWWAVLAALTCATIEMINTVLGNATLLLFFLSSGFVPVAAFPGFLHPLVRANPFSVATEALVGLSRGGPVASPVQQTLAWTLGASAICAALAVPRYAALTRRS